MTLNCLRMTNPMNENWPALEKVTPLSELEDPEEADQLCASKWRYAAERLRRSLSEERDWVQALDAVELAVALRVSDDAAQQRLVDGLLAVVAEARDTPLEEIILLCMAQTPERFLDGGIRGAAITSLACEMSTAGRRPSATYGNEAAKAAIQAQRRVDDLRQRLADRYTRGPALTWADMTLEHVQLADAVPLSVALTIQPERTGQLVMELIHEVTHAYCLIGPIGWSVQAHRAAVRVFEMMMLPERQRPAAGREAEDRLVVDRIEAAALPRALAKVQLDARVCCAMFQAAWLPWLEGVAQYVELLADPVANPNEIITPHAAVRSLIDYRPERPIKSEEELERFYDRIAAEFDGFVSETLKSQSRWRHEAYVTPGERRDIYFLGYLTVRSVVARWEATLGRRIEPVRAAKLLADASQRGTKEVVLRQIANDYGSEDGLIREMVLWVEKVAAIDKAGLTTFFEDVDRRSTGHEYVWCDGRPRRATPREVREARSGLTLEEFEVVFERFLHGDAVPGGRRVAPGLEQLMETGRTIAMDLLRTYAGGNRFLPVGRNLAKLIILEDEEKMLVCIRAYADLFGPAAADADNRYVVVGFDMPASVQDDLRRICARAGTVRALATRVIDLTGDDKRGMVPGSYVGLFFGNGEWEIVGVGPEMKATDVVDAEFVGWIRNRVVGSPILDGGERQLGSVEFLSKRLLASDPQNEPALTAQAMDVDRRSRSAAFRMAERSFGLSTERLESALQRTLSSEVGAVDASGYLHATGTAAEPRLDTDSPLVGWFAEDSYSGIKPFGGRG